MSVAVNANTAVMAIPFNELNGYNNKDICAITCTCSYICDILGNEAMMQTI